MNTKLDTGRVFERIFQIYGNQFTLLIPAAPEATASVPAVADTGLAALDARLGRRGTAS